MSTKIAGAALWLCAVSAHAADTLSSALTEGTPSLDVRLRAEHVDNDSAAQPLDSDAATLRARLGYASAKWNGFDGMLEYEGVTAWDGTTYNSTTNGQTARPAIADPKGSELNQAFLRYTGIPGTTVQAGRERLLLDNQRWVGNVGWRQNEQTYDGVVLNNKSLPGFELTYAYFHNVNSVVFTDFAVKANLVNVSYSPGGWLKATLYGYALDFAAPNTGNRQDGFTGGVRLAGTPALGDGVKILYAAEYARQMEYEEANPNANADYYLGELGAVLGRAQIKGGYEVMGSNHGLYAVQSPLATLHAFDGWADMFLVTPANGLRDTYASLGATLSGFTLTAVGHHFAADFGGADDGDEADASVGYAFSPQLAGLVKYARYNALGSPATTFAGNVDSEKGWVQLEYKF